MKRTSNTHLLLSEVNQIIENYEHLKLSLIDLGAALEAHQNNIFLNKNSLKPKIYFANTK
ncbi:hypothetical protein BGP_0772 [Beggiatoa sp. PS]|nr:hypothetical protein BGP_0772 [Beggiatoa sp. PS]